MNAFETLAPAEPYYTVRTQRKYRTKNLSSAHISEFFKSGLDVSNQICYFVGKTHFEVCIDFGCGVGRILKSFPAKFKFGVDSCSAMLKECSLNVPKATLYNKIPTNHCFPCAIVYSAITFQHIPEQEGCFLFIDLLKLKPKYFCIEFCVGDIRPKIVKVLHRWSFIPVLAGISNILRLRKWSEPRIPMYCYNLTNLINITREYNYGWKVVEPRTEDGFRRIWLIGAGPGDCQV